MGKFDAYNIQLKTIPVGKSEVEFHLDHNFFELLGDVEIRKGDLIARVKVNKTTKESELTFELEGKVVVLCDRCLDEMDQPIKTSAHLIVRLGKEFKDDGDEIVIVPEEQGIINVLWFLYEYIELAVPIKHVHPFGQCNKGMANKLSEHLVDSDEEDNFGFDDSADEDE